MKTLTRNILRLGALLTVALGLAAAGWLSLGSAALAAPAAALPPTTCNSTGPSARTCELWATTGSLSLPGGATVPIWGYTDQAAGAAQLPGPPIVANEGETLTVILHNDLAEASALVFPGQDLVPDLDGVAPGGTITYTFVADSPGTFSYEAGLTSNGTRQVAMGLFGGLIVRPGSTPTWAYDDAATAFDDEALLIYSEVDPALNADPAGFNMTDYAPDYYLINGEAYSNTTPIPSMAGHKVLLRQLNAGFIHHSIGVLGLPQQVLAIDGNLFPHSYQAVAETIATGQTLDTMVAITTTAPAGSQYPVFEQGWRIHNAGQTLSPGGPLSFGGMLTFISLGGTPAGTDTVGPLANDASVTPSPTNGALGITLTATLDESTTGGSTVVAAEYSTDTLGAPGSGTPIAIGAAGTTVPVKVQIPPASVALLNSGEHFLYIRGQDALGNWGPVGSAPFNLVLAGPVISAMVLTPDTTNGTQDVGIQATGDARPSGAADVVQAEYFIDAPGTPGSGTPMATNRIAPVASLTATVPAATLQAMAEGPHTIYIHAQDSQNNWGDWGQVVLSVDKTGPGASNLFIAPNPNNGTVGISPTLAVVRLRADFGDPVVGGINSNIERAEAFIDTVGADGSGNLMTANDGKFHMSVEPGYIFFPLFTIQSLSAGPHTFYVHAKDIAGNWGPMASVVLIVDKVGPVVSGLTITPSPTNGATGASLTATATDPANPNASPSNIVAAEWFVGTDPGVGNGTALAAADGAFNQPTEGLVGAFNVSGWSQGDHVLSVRAKDAAGDWGAVVTATLTIRGQRIVSIFANGFEAGNLAAWNQAAGPVTVNNTAAMAGHFGMAAAIDTGAAGFVGNGIIARGDMPAYEAIYSARFYFDPNGADTAGSQHAIFVAKDGSDTSIFAIEYRHIQNNGTPYEVRAWALTSSGQEATAWYPVKDGPNVLEIGWESSQTGSTSLYVNDVLVETLADIETNDYLVYQVKLGAPEGVLSAMQGTEYFDEFASARSLRVPYIKYLPLVSKQ